MFPSGSLFARITSHYLCSCDTHYQSMKPTENEISHQLSSTSIVHYFAVFCGSTSNHKDHIPLCRLVCIVDDLAPTSTPTMTDNNSNNNDRNTIILQTRLERVSVIMNTKELLMSNDDWMQLVSAPQSDVDTLLERGIRDVETFEIVRRVVLCLIARKDKHGRPISLPILRAVDMSRSHYNAQQITLRVSLTKEKELEDMRQESKISSVVLSELQETLNRIEERSQERARDHDARRTHLYRRVVLLRKQSELLSNAPPRYAQVIAQHGGSGNLAADHEEHTIVEDAESHDGDVMRVEVRSLNVTTLHEESTNGHANAHTKVTLFVLFQRVFFSALSSCCRTRRCLMLQESPIVAKINKGSFLTRLESFIKHSWYDTRGDVVDSVIAAKGEINVDWRQYPRAALGGAIRDRYFMSNRHTAFLSEMRADEMCLVPFPLHKARQEWERLVQSDPVAFRFRIFDVRRNQALNAVAQKLYFDPNDGVLLPSSTVSGALSMIVKSQPFVMGDRVLFFVGDPNARPIARYLHKNFGVDAVWVKVPLPSSDTFAIECVEAALSGSVGPQKPKLALVPWHLAALAWPLPALRIEALLRKHNVATVVDVTHPVTYSSDVRCNRMCNLPFTCSVVRLSELLHCSHDVVLVVTKSDKQPLLHPLTVSYHHGEGYEEEFSYTGLYDCTSVLVLLQSVEFLKRCCGGRSAVATYSRELAKHAVRLLTTKWHEKCLNDSDRLMVTPIVVVPGGRESINANRTTAHRLRSHLAERAIHVDVVDVTFDQARVLAVRLHLRLYNTLSEVERLGDAVSELAGQYAQL